MKRFTSLLLALTLLVGCVSVLSSCGSDDNGAEFNVYLGDEIYDFDPSDYYVDRNAEQVMSLLYEPLFRLSSRGKLKCAAAKSYSVDEDTRTITINIRETYWSNGARVQSSDFAFAWRSVLDPENSNPAAALFYDIEGAVKAKNGEIGIYSEELGIKAESAYKLKIVYREGADYKQLLKNLASLPASPINQNEYEKNPDGWSKSVNSMVFNGPFTVASLNYEEGSFRLSRNLGYHQNPIEAKNVKKYVNPSALISFFSQDDILGLTYQDIEDKAVFFMADAPLADRIENRKKAETEDLLSTYTYVFNTTNPFLANKNVRKALTIAIDRDAIISAVTFGEAATGFVPNACDEFRDGDHISTSAKTQEAKALLDAVSGIGSMDTSITLTVNDDEESKAIAALVKASWEALGYGISVTVKAVDYKKTASGKTSFYDSEIQYIVKEASVGKYDYDVIGIDWMMFSHDPFVGLASLSSYYGGNGYDIDKDVDRINITGWKNDNYDKLIDEAFKATDDDVREQKLNDAEALLLDECPVAPIMFNQNFAYVGGKLKNVDTDGFGYFVLTEASLKNYQKYLKTEEE